MKFKTNGELTTPDASHKKAIKERNYIKALIKVLAVLAGADKEN